MGGSPVESDPLVCNSSNLEERKKMPISVESLRLELEMEDEWWFDESDSEPMAATDSSPRELWTTSDDSEVVVSAAAAAAAAAPTPAVTICARRQCSDGKAKKNVAFASIQIRSYTVILGDHPCCVVGCPLSLGWEFAEQTPLPIDDYEAVRTRRRSRDELRTTWEMRREILEDYTDGDVRRVQRRLHRERSCRNKALAASFFTPSSSPMNLMRTPTCE